MYLTWKELLSKQSPSCFLVTARERDIDIFSGKDTTGKSTSTIIRSNYCKTKDELFPIFASALQFPYYFGNNWDAFDECMAFLTLIESEAQIIFITNSDKIMSEASTKDITIFFDIIESTLKYWDKQNKIIKLIFHSDNESDVHPKIIKLSQNRILNPFDDIQ